jgi:cytoskeletal protein CcmA (bactofilin family)
MDKRKADGSISLLSKKVKIEGEIQGDENLQVEGHFKGSIRLKGDIFVGRGGVVQADVEADNVVIQGKINGNVVARKQLEIQSSGQLLGDCTAQSIDIKEGAVFDGRLNMLHSSAASSGTGGSLAASAKPGAKNQSK